MKSAIRRRQVRLEVVNYQFFFFELAQFGVVGGCGDPSPFRIRRLSVLP